MTLSAGKSVSGVVASNQPNGNVIYKYVVAHPSLLTKSTLNTQILDDRVTCVLILIIAR